VKRVYSCIPKRSKIETDRVPVEWLYDMAVHEGNSKKPVYRIHKWWARRLGSIFRALLLMSIMPSRMQTRRIVKDFYSKHEFGNFTILDPFMGGGTSIVEASKLGARTIGIDIDPMAWFVTKKELEQCPVPEIEATLESLERSVGSRIRSYYITKDHDGKLVPVIYYFWVDVIACPMCETEFEAHPHYQLSFETKKNEQTVFCSACHTVAVVPLSQAVVTCKTCGSSTNIHHGSVRLGRFTCWKCKHSAEVISLARPGRFLAKRLFAVEYESTNDRGKTISAYKAADDDDILTYENAAGMFEALKEQLPFPRSAIPTENRNDPRPTSHGYRYYYELFNHRQLLSLSLLWAEITKIESKRVREFFVLAFSDSLASNNMLCSYAFGYRKLTPLFGLHAFNIVNRPVENNVWGATRGRGTFTKCIKKLTDGKRYADKPYELKYEGNQPAQVFTGERITTRVTASPSDFFANKCKTLLLNKSARKMGWLKTEAVDIVITDPPYYDNLSYSELSDFYYVWIRDYLPNDGHHENGSSTPYQRALLVSKNGNSSGERFARELTQIFRHCERVLKRDGLMVFTFHHRNRLAWEALAKALWQARFVITNVVPVRSEGKSGFHSTLGTVKWDCVIVCRKREGDIPESLNYLGFLRSLRGKQERWMLRVVKASLDFQWPDSLSLGYALAMQQAVGRASSLADVTNLLCRAEKLLIQKLSPDQRKLLRRQ
jgi:putative DNA methylase